MRTGTRFLALSLAVAGAASLTACGENLRLEPSVPCTGGCVPFFRVNIENLALISGDTFRLGAHPITADGREVGTKWSVWYGPLRVDSTGLVTALAPGRGAILARPATDSGSTMGADIWIVHPDTSAQPFLAVIRDAATGDTVRRGRFGYDLPDSVDVSVSYVLGTTTETVGPPALVFEMRTWAHEYRPTTLVYSASIPLPTRGRAAFVTFRVNLAERNPDGTRRYPRGFYNFFVMLPLANGTTLGDRTGYTISL